MPRLAIAALTVLLVSPALAQEPGEDAVLYRDESWVHIGDDRFAPDSSAADDLSQKSAGAVHTFRIALDAAAIARAAEDRWRSAVLSGEAIGNDSGRVPSATATFVSIGGTEVGRIETSGRFELRFDKALLPADPATPLVVRIASGINGPTDRDDQEVGYFRLELSTEAPPEPDAGQAAPEAAGEPVRRRLSIPAEPRIGSYVLWGTRRADGSRGMTRWAVAGGGPDQWIVEETRYGETLPESVVAYRVDSEGKVLAAWRGLPGRVGRPIDLEAKEEGGPFEAAREPGGDPERRSLGDRAVLATPVDVTYRDPADESVVRTVRAWYAKEGPALAPERGAAKDGTDLGPLVWIESKEGDATSQSAVVAEGDEGATRHLSLPE